MVLQKQIQKAPNKATYAIRSMALLESRVSCIMFLKEWKNIMTQPCESAREKWGYLQKGSTRTSFDNNNNNNNYTTTTITSKKKVNQGEEDIANILSDILNDLPYKRERWVTCAEEQNEKKVTCFTCANVW